MRKLLGSTVPATPVLAVAIMAALNVGCGKTDEAGAGSGSITISGTITTGATISRLGRSSLGLIPEFEASFVPAKDLGPVLAATQCNDGYYYVVRCVSLGQVIAAGDGNVSCTGATGGFSIAGMPANEAIGCFIRRSVTGTTYTTMGTIEFPAATLSGSNSTIVGTGDLKFNVAISNTGVITATVDSSTASNVASSSSAGTDPTALNGIYDLACATGVSGEVFDSVKCKCSLYADGNYPDTGMGSRENCLADNAAQIPANAVMKVDFNVYKGTTTGFEDVPAGDIFGVTIWDATGGVSARSTGGEGLPTMGGAISWESSQGSNAIAWLTSFNGGGSMTAVPTSSVPAATANVGAWQNWIEAMVQYALANGWTCTYDDWMSAGTGNEQQNGGNNGMCYMQFLNEVYRSVGRSSRLPRLYGETRCDNTGCGTLKTHFRVYAEGLNFDYSAASSPTTNVSTIPSDGGVGANPGPRFVAEQWLPIPGGGGSFRQRNEFDQFYRCVSDSSGLSTYEFTDAACPTKASNQWVGLRCKVAEETKFTFVPAGTGKLNGTFETRTMLGGVDTASLHGTTLTPGVDPVTRCQQVVSGQDSMFKVEMTKN
jgi:hypothetical protein